ncbi:MAG: hypothetical protein JETCAE03_27420 [Ignavibacteriaceae bacterium]|nr:T9SS type A sorting domain-containing protein [Ignavibacteriales bacterium]MCL4278387.1 T9SS type A sorting domain-containing protein [Ignavibacteriaceae bacterium]MEB2296042.1 T9SS type A sorting domain-containing protein [Ignavibacteria bacterium]MCZ7612795.1 T9SS type A sorting domain-containing protein [Ignavibacteriaceae bacterium]NUM63459.1 T9SS type A sorting domain-containing protein [Ignavibacteriaceae bacterium]
MKTIFKITSIIILIYSFQMFGQYQVNIDIVKPSAGDKPSDYSLNQNYPNPFNPTTTISYSIKSAGDVTLKVYDMLGTEVANLVNERQEAGNYSIEFNAAELPSGIYVYRLASGNFMETKKLVLLK